MQLENHSFIGSTISKGRSNFDKYLQKGLECQLLLLEYGGNDSDYDWPKIAAAPQQKHLPKTLLPDFEQAYGELISQGVSLGTVSYTHL